MLKRAFKSLALGMLLTLGTRLALAQGHVVYVTNEDSNDVTIIDGITNKVLATIPVGKRPRGLKLNADGSKLYVAVSGAPKCPPAMKDEDCDRLEPDFSADGIAEVDTASHAVLRVLQGGFDPEQFDGDWKNGLLYVANESANQASVLGLERGELIAAVPTGAQPEGVRVSPDGKLVYVTNEIDGDISVIDAATNKSKAKIKSGLRPRDIAFSSDSKRAYISNEVGASIAVIDVDNARVVNTFALPEGSLPMGLVLAKDNQTLYIATGRGHQVLAMNVANGKIKAAVEVSRRPWGLAISPDGSKLYSANGPSNDISVIDVASFKIVARINTGKSPWGVQVGPKR
ncbi:MAG TPA: beta-propeller fold lactonase family protein [Candidatus Acidoferrum sp.]|nr:beta-propeller fold lactonase family protein [Candidatus Acidoferrum sp.]